MKLDLDCWRLIVPSCVFTALSTVLTAMLCGFIISFSGAAGISRSTQCSISLLPADAPRVGQKGKSYWRAENETKTFPVSALACKSREDTESIWKVWELPLCKGWDVQRNFSVLQKRGENDETCMHERIFYCKRSYFQPQCKGITEHQLFWFSFQVGEINHDIIEKISKSLSWLLQLAFSISRIKIYLFHENLW